MPPKNESSEAEEMVRYGFDPMNQADVSAFHATDPQEASTEIDYSKDNFEFGGRHEAEPSPGQPH